MIGYPQLPWYSWISYEWCYKIYLNDEAAVNTPAAVDVNATQFVFLILKNASLFSAAMRLNLYLE